MVAFYLQNTKKVVIVLFLFTALTFIKCSNLLIEGKQAENTNYCKEIKDYLKLELSFSTDTVRLGEYLDVNIYFINYVDTLLAFYPKGVLFLSQPIIGFEYDSYMINDTLDVTFVREIRPFSSYLQNYKIAITSNFFRIGDNHLTLCYLWKEMNGRDKIYNKLCGSLESQEISLYVLP